MPADTSVKFFASWMTGAPALSSAAGALIGILDACLINGWGGGTVDSVSVSGGIATVSKSTGHPMDVGTVVLISGATPAGLNGEKRVISRTTNSYTFDATGVADGAATGTISHKIAPAGWIKAFAGTNLGAYKSADPAATGCYLRVDDTTTTHSPVRGYETMTDINNGTGMFPSGAGTFHWSKSNYSNANWVLVADSRAFYFFPCGYNSYAKFYQTVNGFGDMISTKQPDPFGCFIQAGRNDIVNDTPGAGGENFSNGSNVAEGPIAPRSYTGIGGAASLFKFFSVFGPANTSQYQSGSGSYGSPSYLPYPNPTDGGLYLSPITFAEINGGALRGYAPGIYGAPQRIGTGTFGLKDRVNANTSLGNRQVQALTNYYGVMFIDVSGPWR